MNYGKRKAAKKQKRITSKSTMQGKRVGVRLFKAFLLCIVLVGIVAVIGVGVFAKRIIDNAPDVTPDDVKPQGYTTFVYADDGKTEIGRFVASGANRVYKSIDEIPEDLQHAFVAVEDERFYEHNGVDIKGLARSVVSTLSGHMQGASTLTQQLIKNNIFPNFVNEETIMDKIERKIQEQFLALQIEKQMNKSEIIEAYMNTINLGQNCLGVQSAAQRYFNKDVSELTLSECAVIAGITQNPGGLNPITNPDANASRRDKILNNMLEQGYISKEAYNEAKEDDVYARIQKVNNKEEEKKSTTSYFVDALTEQVMDDLQEQLGYTETQAYNALYSGGLTIYSTQNKEMQAICDEETKDDSNYPWLKEYGLDYALTVTRADGSVENYSSGHIKRYVKETYNDSQGLVFSSKDSAKAMIKEWKKTIAQEGDTYDEVINLTPQPQASVTIMDQSTGEIKAMVGGRGTKKNTLSLNRAYRGSARQPGSTFKILAAYAPALDTNAVTLSSIYNDENYTLKSGKVVAGHRGPMSIKDAIVWSKNSIAVQVSDEITQELGYEYCEDFGISTLVDSEEINGKIYSDINQTLALGGLTHGVYNYELCAAYAAIANEGEYNTPTLYTKIVDHDGNVLLDGGGEKRTVIKKTTAGLLTMAMEAVVNGGTGSSCRLSNMPVAGKTGTTTNDVDLWFCGFTPYYTCAVWGGYDDNKPCNSDTTFRFRLWKNIMERIHSDLEYRDFDIYNSLIKKTVCADTGLLVSSEYCRGTTEYFAEGEVPTERCPGHKDREEEAKRKEEEERQQEEEQQQEEETGQQNPPANPTTPPTDGGGGTGGGTDEGTGDGTGGGDAGGTGGDTGGTT